MERRHQMSWLMGSARASSQHDTWTWDVLFCRTAPSASERTDVKVHINIFLFYSRLIGKRRRVGRLRWASDDGFSPLMIPVVEKGIRLMMISTMTKKNPDNLPLLGQLWYHTTVILHRPVFTEVVPSHTESLISRDNPKKCRRKT